MVLYRLLTEGTTENRVMTEDFDQNIQGTVSSYFDGFTIIKGTGFWKATRENCTVIEIVADDSEDTKASIREIAETIREINKQESVLVQSIEVEHSEFV